MIYNTEKPFVVMSVGIPGSGKTTILKDLEYPMGAIRICPDDIREELSGDAANQESSKEAWDIAYDRAREIIGDGGSVLMDGTHTAYRYRPESIRRYKDYGALAVYALLVEVSLKTALKRNSNRDRVVPVRVIKNMHNSLTQHPPTSSEGFERVVRIQNN